MPLIDPITMSASTKSSPLKPPLPIELLPNDVARIYAHVHPVLLLSAFYLRFPALVSDPVPTLLKSLLPLAIIQGSYVTICLPATGSATKIVKKAKAGVKRSDGLGHKPVTVFVALILSLLSVPILMLIQILFGAPITTHQPQTFLCSAHIALLALFPLIYVHGIDTAKWREVASFYSPIDEVFGAAVGAFLGAWLGAVPIPLDWDREWQKWPITIVTGAYAGYLVGKLAGGWLFKGKRIELD